MRQLSFAIVPWLLLASCATKTPTSSPSTTAGVSSSHHSALVDGKVLPIPGFSRGINLGNGLDAPTEGEWGVVLVEKHFEMAKAAGFDHVRLPVRFSAHAENQAPYTIAPDFFARVDWALAQAEKQGLHLILDVHHYNELMDEPDVHGERFVGIWTQIAERYAGRGDFLAFELLNEPSKNLNATKLNALYAKTLPLVRAKHPTRLIFVDSYFWANTNYLRALTLPDDPQIVAEFHMYQPILFTHQGAPWMGPEYGTEGVVFPGPPVTPLVPVDTSVSWVREFFDKYNTLPAEQNPSGMQIVKAEFDRAITYADKFGHRVYLGEFGAIDKADPESRARFVRSVRLEATQRGIGWCYWDDGGSFKAMNVADGTWVEYLRDALLK